MMRNIALSIIVMALFACDQTGNVSTAQTAATPNANASAMSVSEEIPLISSDFELKNRTDSMSYAIGRDIASSLSKQGIGFNADLLGQGIHSVMYNQMSELSDDQIRQLLMALQMEIRQKQQAAQAQAMAPRSNITEGQLAPDISLPTPEGNNLSLSDLRGKYVLVDFWAAWCRPCRMENPNVVRLYNRFKDKGFEILGVSLDRTRDAWLGAIKQDGLTWKHISDLKFWQSAAAKTYGVSAIPYTVLVDPDGKVIAQNLRGQALERKLEELMGS